MGRNRSGGVLLVVLAVAVAVAWRPADVVGGEPFAHAVVAADHPRASQAGVEMLKQGGNVVDAAVATGLALSVLRPASSGLGGGGFMVIYDAGTRQAVCLDYREQAPAAAHRDMYLDPLNPNRAIPDRSRYGPLATGIPGHVAGLACALKRFGTLDFKTVLGPALSIAREGRRLDPADRNARASMIARFRLNPALPARFEGLWKKYLFSGRLPDENTKVVSPQLPALERLARKGWKDFYRGRIARKLADFSRSQGGLLTRRDLRGIRPKLRTAVRGRLGELEIFSMPPPSSGGVALVETLNILSAFERTHPDQSLRQLGHNSPRYIHVVTEALKHAFADRAAYLGDADFVDVPLGRLVDPGYARRLAARIDPKKTGDTRSYGRFLPVDDEGTSHFSVIDNRGNAVACTETINSTFGSLLVEPTYGIVLNNQMDDFAARPGQPNLYGLVESEANAVAAGKRPLSSMTPTILVRDGRAVLAVGASGGPRIISATLQVVLNVVRFEMSPREAVAAARFHHQWMPETLFLEPRLFEKTAAALRPFGHAVSRRRGLGTSQLAGWSSDGGRGASDPRKYGRHAGF